MKIQHLKGVPCPHCDNGFVVRVSYDRPATLLFNNKSLTISVHHVVRECYECRKEHTSIEDHDYVAEAQRKGEEQGFLLSGQTPDIKLGY